MIAEKQRSRRSRASLLWRAGGASLLLACTTQVWVCAGLRAAEGEAEAAGLSVRAADDLVVQNFLEARLKKDPDDTNALNRLADLYLRRLRATGDLSWLDRAVATARHSLEVVPASANAGGLAAQVRGDFESHRFAAARDGSLQLRDGRNHGSQGNFLLGDALLELGEPDQAEAAWQAALAAADTTGDLELTIRQARLAWLRGQIDAARDKFADALKITSDPLAPQPTTALWCHIQRGQMAFSLGDWPGAEADYLAAQKLDPENYTVLDHLAELRAAQKQYSVAAALYEKVIARTGGRPEFVQALGDMYAFAGNAAEAKIWRDRARDAYLQRAATGGLYDHHLAGFYSDSEPDPGEAVRWARRDLEARKSVFAYDSLAWALYQAGDFPAARDAAQQALALNTPDAHIVYHAGMIYSRAGDLARGAELLRHVAELNPHYFDSFHVHR